MSTHNIQFHDRIRKFPQNSVNICLLEVHVSEEFRGDEFVSVMVNEPLVLQLLRFDCRITNLHTRNSGVKW